jgi:hypothetical protein
LFPKPILGLGFAGGGHERAVLGEGVRKVFSVLSAAFL